MYGMDDYSGTQIGGAQLTNENNSYASNKPSRPQVPYEKRMLSQLTIKQILTAPEPRPDESLEIDGQPISQLVMLARITSVDVQSSHISYKLNDNTGSIMAKQWLNDNGDQTSFPDNTWVRIIGRINHFNGRSSINVFNISKVDNFNEITHHFLEVIAAHLFHTTRDLVKDNPMSNNNNSNTNANAGMTNMAGNNNMNTMNNMNGNNNGQSVGSAMAGMSMTTNNLGLPRLQQVLVNLINTPEFENSATGANVEVIFQRLPNEDVDQIREAIDELAQSGHLYSTVDDDHYKFSGQ